MGTHTEELCRLDSYIGDGDHGVTIERGFRAAVASLAGAETARALFFAMGEIMSGAIGPLYGMFWRDVGKDLDGADITPQAIGGAWQRGCEALMRIGPTSPGDETIADLDALGEIIEQIHLPTYILGGHAAPSFATLLETVVGLKRLPICGLMFGRNLWQYSDMAQRVHEIVRVLNG